MSPQKLALVVAGSTIILTTAMPISAATPAVGTRFTVEATVPSSKSLILRDAIWQCSDNSCFTPRLTARPAIVCEAAARKFGKVSSFVTDGIAFTEEKLAKCNRKAR